MPTQKFTNLCEYKKRAILNAMREELLQTSYSNIKVSQIIKRARISRASFYIYFEGKEDILFSLLYQMMRDFAVKLEETFREQGGIFLNSMKKLLSWLLEDDSGMLYGRIYNYVMSEEECKRVFIQVEKQFYREGQQDKSCRSCYEVMDMSQYPKLTEEPLLHAIAMGSLALFKAAILQLEGSMELGLLKKMTEKQLQILDNGIRG